MTQLLNNSKSIEFYERILAKLLKKYTLLDWEYAKVWNVGDRTCKQMQRCANLSAQFRVVNKRINEVQQVIKRKRLMGMMNLN